MSGGKSGTTETRLRVGAARGRKREGMKTKKEKSQYIIRTVSHALDVLEQFQEDVAELGVTELSRRLKLHKNNVFRLLATLESRNFIEQNRTTGNYRLGLKNLQLGQTTARQMQLIHHTRPLLEQLATESSETCYVAVMREGRVLYLDTVDTTLPVRVVTRVGSRLPPHSTAAGKLLLALLPESELAEFLSGRVLEPFTPTTITDPDALRQELRRIEEQGYALEDEELHVGVRGVCAPIRDYSGMIVGAVGIEAPVMRSSAERMEAELIPLVLKAAEECSAGLGCSLDKAV